ncbi:hypothetical protein ACFOG5_22410 [Pedobacter fastidiosus]
MAYHNTWSRHNGDRLGQQRKAVAVRYYIPPTERPDQSPVAQPG